MMKSTHTKEENSILKTNYIGNLAYIYHDKPFVVPMTYFYKEDENSIICYSGLGHKIDALRLKSAVSLCVYNMKKVSKWQSVLVKGTYRERTGSDAKAMLHKFVLGVKEIIKNEEKDQLNFVHEFSSGIKENDFPVVFTIEIDEITSSSRDF